MWPRRRSAPGDNRRRPMSSNRTAADSGDARLASGVFVDAMRPEDIPSVRYVERRCFDSPWPRGAFNAELRRAPKAGYIVLRLRGTVINPGQSSSPSGIGGIFQRIAGRGDWNEANLVGFAGTWYLADEAHITTIAVDPDYQGLGLGRLLLLCIADRGRRMGARRMTLEVRHSNRRAQSIYARMGFFEKAVRKSYYSDNREDAIVMWSDDVDSPRMTKVLDRTRVQLTTEFDWKMVD